MVDSINRNLLPRMSFVGRRDAQTLQIMDSGWPLESSTSLLLILMRKPKKR